MIEIDGLTKRHGGRAVVDDLTFQVRPGQVTGFLGPNGAGKSTTMRMVLGLERPSAGRATIGGRAYRDLPVPLRAVGALLEARATAGGRTAAAHLACLARADRIPRGRVDDVLGLVGLADVAGRPTRTFSLGMHQRLGIAAALLGDPAVLLLDEPVNGLDSEGIRWIRGLLRSLAAEGRTVLLSSHLMSEMELTADHLVVIAGGRLVADAPVRDLVAGGQGLTVVRAPDEGGLRAVVEGAGGSLSPRPGGGWEVRGLAAEAVGEACAAAGVALHELTPRHRSLEEAYAEVTSGGRP